MLCEALRPATVLAKALATLDRICGGRLDVGHRRRLVRARVRGDRHGHAAARASAWPGSREAVEVAPRPRSAVVRARSTGASTAPTVPRTSRPRCSSRARRSSSAARATGCSARVADVADGWNTCWVWTPAAYRERLDVLDARATRSGRDPATVWRSLGLYALCGEDERDLARRFERLRRVTPPGCSTAMTLDEWRVGRLVGTVEQVREQAAAWAGLGVETLILGVGAVPFAVERRRRRRIAGRGPRGTVVAGDR